MSTLVWIGQTTDSYDQSLSWMVFWPDVCADLLRPWFNSDFCAGTRMVSCPPPQRSFCCGRRLRDASRLVWREMARYCETIYHGSGYTRRYYRHGCSASCWTGRNRWEESNAEPSKFPVCKRRKTYYYCSTVMSILEKYHQKISYPKCLFH